MTTYQCHSYILVVDRVGADEYDPGMDRYVIATKAVASEGRRVHPLVHYIGGGYEVRAEASTVKELKKRLKAMLKACDQRPMRLVETDVKIVQE